MNKEQEISKVEERMISIENKINEISQVVGKLETKINPILTPNNSPCEADKSINKKIVPNENSILTTTLTDFYFKLMFIDETLLDLVERVEL